MISTNNIIITAILLLNFLSNSQASSINIINDNYEEQHSHSMQVRDIGHDERNYNRNTDDKSGEYAGIVFEKVVSFRNNFNFTKLFNIEKAGTYDASLTDFTFPNPLKTISLNITDSSISYGQLFDVGSFTFEALPGDYYISLFAEVDPDFLHGKFGASITFSETSPVPLPASLLLFLTGLFTIFHTGRLKLSTSVTPDPGVTKP